jgi:tripartite-type tricarboxylate transporter receptor subunit TctC
VLVTGAGAASADYPDKPVEVVVPFTAGGGTDLIARLVADYLGQEVEPALLVVNKPGGGGVIGARAALNESRPDGYPALMDIHTTSSMLIGAWKTPPLKLEDRKFAARIVRDPMVFAVKTDAPSGSSRCSPRAASSTCPTCRPRRSRARRRTPS